ncbi:ribonuclease P [Desulfurococcus amylolyticus]|uniref:Ribonuclease P subunit p30 n=1 Tax=Desulfurococcus amylolyticus (strain DSM 18924 / JCM 16383 / VKM B-2413 / 1221n) TaxID=490899 RepID=B8D6C4_DESA1|nr:ribonuclease P [Desulfurococcus amylolyticus]ACL11655.1 Ribonuclease P subunit p30 [Desulfurococcus amylolyticus 1221n]
MFIDVNVANCTGDVLEAAGRLYFKFIACNDLREPLETRSLVAIPRLVLKATSVTELKNMLSTQGGIAYTAVTPLSLQTARWSTHDSRVNVIIMNDENIEFFDVKQFRAMKTHNKPLEISLKSLLALDDVKRGQAYRRINLALRMNISLIVGSGAEHWWELYHPRAIISLLKTLYDVPEPVALASITTRPYQIISEKLQLTRGKVGRDE